MPVVMSIRSVSFEKQSLLNQGLLQILKEKIKKKGNLGLYLGEELMKRM